MYAVGYQRGTYGTNPRRATTDGRDRIPRAMVSATMTVSMISNKFERGQGLVSVAILMPQCLCDSETLANFAVQLTRRGQSSLTTTTW